MSLQQGSAILSKDIIAFKTRVKAEMARRKYKDSLASYATDFTNPANKNNLAKLSHFNETVGFINLIKATGIQSDAIKNISAADVALANYEDTPVTSASTDCTGSSCRGLCYTTCSGGCKSGCKNGCESSCTGKCKGGCSSCSGGCAGTCGAACSKTCADVCTTAHGSCSNEASSVPGHK